MKRKSAMTLISFLVIVLEIIPTGVVCLFSDDNGVTIKKTFSYFDLTPYAYGDFAPFITALLSCLTLILCIVYCLRGRRSINSAIAIFSLFAAFISVIPIIYEDYTIVGVIISAGLMTTFTLSVLEKRRFK